MRNVKLGIALAITMVAEGMITVTLVWSGAQAGQSPVILGLVLFVMNIVPFVAQKLAAPLARIISSQPLKALIWIRVLGVPIALSGFLFLNENAGSWVLVLATGLAFVTFLSQQAIETYMGQLTVSGHLSASSAARLSQAALQGGVFIGNALAGVIIAILGTHYVYAVIGALFLASIGLSGFHDTSDVQQSNRKNAPSNIALHSTGSGWMLVACMAFLAVQMMGFNYFVPLIFEARSDLTAAHYGFVSAAAGIGALLATVIKIRSSVLAVALGIMVSASDAVIGHSSHITLALASGFVIGFGFNLARVRVRQLVFESLQSHSEAAIWGGRITLGFRATAALAPLGFGALMTITQGPSPAMLFAIIGTVVMGFLLPSMLFAVEYKAVKAGVLHE